MGRKWRTKISLVFETLRVESGGPGFTLCCYTFGPGDENCARAGAAAGISGAFLHAVLEKHFFVTPPAEYREPGVVGKIKRYSYGDKCAPPGWQDHFEKTMLELGFGRLESEAGCFVKKGVSHKDTIIDLLSVGKRKHLDNFFVQMENVETQACRVH